MNDTTKGTVFTGYFEINAEHGRIIGDSLYHSFIQFNIDANERATFTGPMHIKNIIIRVTGSEGSSIRGTIISDIPQANIYLLNPADIIFEENSRIDFTGAFYVSTADYLKTEDNTIFEVNSSEPILSTNAPKTFGFLNDNPGKIETYTDCSIQTGKSISFIGGEILIKASLLSASEGRISIVGIQYVEISLNDSWFHYLEYTHRGKILITDNSEIHVSGEASGGIYIMGSEFIVNNSILETSTEDSVNAGNIVIDADLVVISSGSIVFSDATYGGDAGNIHIKATQVNVISSSSIESSVIDYFDTNDGNAGLIFIDAINVNFDSSSRIKNSTMDAGNSGHIIINAEENITLNNESYIVSITQGSGDAGLISLVAPVAPGGTSY